MLTPTSPPLPFAAAPEKGAPGVSLPGKNFVITNACTCILAHFGGLIDNFTPHFENILTIQVQFGD